MPLPSDRHRPRGAGWARRGSGLARRRRGRASSCSRRHRHPIMATRA